MKFNLLKGGKIYGEGVKGKAMNVVSKNSDNFIQLLEDSINGKTAKISGIRLIGLKGDKRIGQNNIPSFIQYMKKQDSFIIKIFKRNIIINNKKSFHNELESVKQIMKIYGKNISKFTTVKQLNYNRYPFVGVELLYKSGKSTFALFYTKCKGITNMKYTTKILNKFIKDILMSITYLQKYNFIHTDIKPDNIVLCKNTFKLIDWDLSHRFNWRHFHKYHSNLFYCAPLTFYIDRVPGFISKRLIYYYNKFMDNKKWVKSKQFQDLYKEISNDFDQITDSDLTKAELFDKYHLKFDIFNVGMSIAHIIFLNKLNYKKYKVFIQKLISFNDSFMFSDASEAYKYFIKKF
jgi:serine/threonine protein kinase